MINGADDRTDEAWWRRSDRHAPLVARPLRVRVLLLALAGAGVTAVLGVHYAGDSRGGHLDRALSEALAMNHGVLRALGQALADLGDPAPVVVAMAVAAALAWWLRGGRGLALVLLAPPLAMATTSLVLKPIVGRTRGGELAFPSGHTTAVASIAVAVAVLVLGLATAPLPLRRGVVLGLGALTGAVAISMVGRNYHYPSDTVGAVGVSLAVVLVVALAVDKWAELLAEPHQPRSELPTDVLPHAVLPRR